MSSPERLNVLISRARNGLILIGNSSTFERSRKGGRLWTQFFDLLRSERYMYKGLPIKCERHPDRIRELSRPEDFDLYSPDGGCTEPWHVHLSLSCSWNVLILSAVICHLAAVPSMSAL